MQFGGLTHLRLEAISRDPGHTLGRPPYLELVGSLPVGRSAEENMAAKPVRLAQLRSLSFARLPSQIPQAAIITTIFTDGLHPDNTVGFLWALACSWRDEATASLGTYKMDQQHSWSSRSPTVPTRIPERPRLEFSDPAFTLWESALEKGTDGQDQTPLDRFPKLRVIKLLGVDFDPRSRGSPIDDIDLILEALEHRSHEDYCISEMQFELCLNISKVYMEAIRRRAPKVKIGWDGTVDLRSYEEKADEFELEDEDEDEEDEEDEEEEDEGEERQPM
ncbi:hypothetical protein DFP72DRAFT_1038957 [Ephemerocybe angulata]|uniref:Uncharacterized protein n=1 Tax=Ephemerocybe angulata TaxID=980116 RepID=A0A8H6IIL5_9AGAR|nr:hypothetical protein DFP72DRAFT_1038957 [Tulosesus angulatus]